MFWGKQSRRVKAAAAAMIQSGEIRSRPVASFIASALMGWTLHGPAIVYNVAFDASCRVKIQ